MPHYNSFDSFKTKKSLDKKQKALDKHNKKELDDFIVDTSDTYGIVIEVRYDDAYVLINDEVILAKLRRDLNQVANKVLFPGDKVIMEDNIITNMFKRTSLLTRNKKDSTRKSDVGLYKNIAANVDLAVIVVASKEPPLHPKFIDRYLMLLQNSNIRAIICLNKCDLKTEKEDELLNVYKELGITVVETSTYNKTGIDELKKYLDGKQAILVGNSGVGKSSLTNAIMDDDEIKTSHVSDKSKRGRHTTTSSKYYIWNDNSSIIDTPGIRSLDVSDFNPIEIQDYFPELDNYKNNCKYNDCLHYHEPYDKCVVKQAVKGNLINRDRYESYLRIMDGIMNEDASNEIMKEL